MGIASIIFIILTIIFFVLLKERLSCNLKFKYNEDAQLILCLFVICLILSTFFILCRIYGHGLVINNISNAIKLINGK